MAVNLHATHFRFGNDDGSTEANHTFKANEDVNISLRKDVTFLLRIIVQETGNTAAANVDNRFQCARNGGAFQDITTSSTICKAVVAASYVDAANTTKRLTGTGTFESSSAGCTEDGLSGGNSNDIAALGCSETVCSLQIVGADTADADSITFRLTSPDFTITNDVVPTLTVLHNVSAAPGDGVVDVAGLAPTVAVTNNANSAPGVGVVTVTGFEPTVTAESGASANSEPGLGELTVAGLAPTIQTPESVAPGLGDVIATGFAPTIQTPESVAPGVGALVVDGFAPIINITVDARPAPGEVVVDGFAPTIDAGQGTTTNAGVGDVIATGFAPTIQTPESAAPGFGELIVEGFAPAVNIGANATPDVGQLLVEGFAPTIQTPLVILPGTGELIIIGFEPTIDIADPSVNATPGCGELFIIGYEPSVAISEIAAPSTGPTTSPRSYGGGISFDSLTGPTINELLKKKKKAKRKTLHPSMSHVIAQIENLF